jgi:hypothetical protein
VNDNLLNFNELAKIASPKIVRAENAKRNSDANECIHEDEYYIKMKQK